MGYLHLLTNHLPIVLCMVAIGFFFYAKLSASRESLLIAIFMMALAGFSVAPAYLSGEAAEDLLHEHKLPHIRKDFIHQHEDVAQISSLMLVILGCLASVEFARVLKKTQNKKSWLQEALGLWTILCFAALAYTAYLGGRISHRELDALEAESELRPIVDPATAVLPVP